MRDLQHEIMRKVQIEVYKTWFAKDIAWQAPRTIIRDPVAIVVGLFRMLVDSHILLAFLGGRVDVVREFSLVSFLNEFIQMR